MASEHAAALGAGAACVGAALAAEVAVLGLVQVLSVALEDDESEDQTEAEWATDRLKRLRLRSRQLRQQRRRNRRKAHARSLPYIRFQWNVRRMKTEEDEIYHRRA